MMMMMMISTFFLWSQNLTAFELFNAAQCITTFFVYSYDK